MLRSREEFVRFFDRPDLELIEPGIESVAHWRADDEPEPRPSAAEAGIYAGVARLR